MTHDQMLEVRAIGEEPSKVSIDMLEDKSDRTLLWGYTCDRASWHVYIRYGEIHLYSYGGSGYENRHLCEQQYLPQDLVPDKRLYPEACDYEFCKLLKTMGANLTFTTFNSEREPKQYHGELYGR